MYFPFPLVALLWQRPHFSLYHLIIPFFKIHIQYEKILPISVVVSSNEILVVVISLLGLFVLISPILSISSAPSKDHKNVLKVMKKNHDIEISLSSVVVSVTYLAVVISLLGLVVLKSPIPSPSSAPPKSCKSVFKIVKKS